MSNKTQPARGTRDFLPSDVRKRNYVIGVIKEVYESYGFEPLETPAVENLETLTGKYGEEGNQLMFRILKRGEKLDLAGGEKGLSDLALRYDLTVPLARVAANYRSELPRFFKRYQIQPVWRADRPARGRYREFYQCDVDAIGSSSMLVEAELISAVSEILQRLGFNDFLIKFNHRDLLYSILNAVNIPKNLQNIALVVLDKMDKIGLGGVYRELLSLSIPKQSCMKLLAFIGRSKQVDAQLLDEDIEIIEEAIKGLRDEKTTSNLQFIESSIDSSLKRNNIILDQIVPFINYNKEGVNAVNELQSIINCLSGNPSARRRLFIDLTLARGLSYYTGAIFEIQVPDLAGSLGGGGRYDGLIGMFGKEQIPACGFSLGLERILVVMDERGMFEKPIAEGKLKLDSADLMIACFDERLVGECLKIAGELRQKDLRVLVYPEAGQKGKPLKYAEQINVPFVCLLKENDLAENKVALKNMRSGEQETVARDELAAKIV